MDKRQPLPIARYIILNTMSATIGMWTGAVIMSGIGLGVQGTLLVIL